MDDTAAAAFQPPLSAAEILDRWSWRDLTDAYRARGFRTTSFIEVAHSGGYTTVWIEGDQSGVHWGPEIDWLDVVVADFNGRRLHEEVGCDGEVSLFPRVA